MFCLGVLLTVSLSGQSPEHNGTNEPVGLITHRSTEKTDIDDALHFFEHPAAIRRYEKIRLNDAVKNTASLRANGFITLNLFDNVRHTAKISRVQANVNGTVTVIARLEKNQGYMILVTTGNKTMGRISIPFSNEEYMIISDPLTSDHFLIEMEDAYPDILEPGPPLLIPDADKKTVKKQKHILKQIEKSDYGPDDPASIDVMIVYTPAARDWANGSSHGNIENVVAMSMATAQVVLDNSETLMTMNLVHSAEVDYQEEKAQVDLRRFTSHPDNPWGTYNGHVIAGYMDEIHEWRDTYGADLCAFFTLTNDVGGTAWLLNNRYGRPDYGFSLTRVQQAATSYTHIHEMGHNMGLDHHKGQNFQEGPTNWTNWAENTWSAGWRWTGTDDKYYCSVMTYSGGSYFADGITHTRVPYFSNPDVYHQGVPTGHAADGNNAGTLLQIKHAIAAYRETVCVPMTLPFSESFDLDHLPDCWDQTTSDATDFEWMVASTSHAGGHPYELRASIASWVGISRLIAPAADLSSVTNPVLRFKHYYDDWGSGATIKIQSSSDRLSWTDESFVYETGSGDLGPETVEVPITTLSETTYIAWVIDGNHTKINNWFVDDVEIVEGYVVPEHLILDNDIVTPGYDPACFDATSTITTGGVDGHFIVESDGQAILIAGESIRMLPGTKVEAGGFLHAYITTTGDYCMPLAKDKPEQEDDPAEELVTTIDEPLPRREGAFFKVYPNPTNGLFTLEMADHYDADRLYVEVYNTLGSRVFQTILPPGRQHALSLKDQQPGIYVIRVGTGDRIGVERLIRR